MTRRWICFILALVMCFALNAGVAEQANGGNDMAKGGRTDTGIVPGNRLGLELLADLSDGTENQMFSPLSLAYALSMAAMGARGETGVALLAALDAQNTADIAALNDRMAELGLRCANAAFVNDEIELLPEYAQALAGAYDAATFPLKDIDQVNAWIGEKTDGLIDGIDGLEIDPTVMLLLMNALAMDAEWELPFQPANTREDVFHAPGGDTRIDFMHQQLSANYGEVSGMQVIRLGYADSDLAMYIALPPEGGMQEALAALAGTGMNGFRLDETPREVMLSLPKIDVTTTLTLTEPLKARGLSLPFEAEADFSGISQTDLCISDVFQKIRVQVDEEGTRAAAATAVAMGKGMVMFGEKPVKMDVNRPFILVIADDVTGAIAFAGVIANP